ncbi:MAG TPA: tetraacyldisaccharide 4'-kinase [Gammaproteobacteria bacterium]|nr:tetraacyldisaccharide 4'-kinase [Gammaproteobacteria bacterium]
MEKTWYQGHWLVKPLLPLSWLFCAIVVLRRFAYRVGIFRSVRFKVPVIVVGNITVGGTGKTPLTIWLARFLARSGYKPGIISRGYGGHARKWPQQVRADADPWIVGDEAIVIARHADCPMAVGPERVADAQAILNHSDCDIIISDDGLQHYPLARKVEIVAIDGHRRFGNGKCLPAGPLREPASRAESADFLVSKNVAGSGEYLLRYVAGPLRKLVDESCTQPLEKLAQQRVHAVAGIANPGAFFAELRKAGLDIIVHEFPDHHFFTATELEFDDDLPVVMTEKDAVKCHRFARDNFWYLPITPELPEEFGIRLLNLLESRNG